MHKINALLRSKHGGIIPYDHYTYREGLVLCNDFKLKCQMNKARVQDKRALWDFCEQFAYNNILKDSSYKRMKPPKRCGLKNHSRNGLHQKQNGLKGLCLKL